MLGGDMNRRRRAFDRGVDGDGRSFKLEPIDGPSETIEGTYAEELVDLVRPSFGRIVLARLRATETSFRWATSERKIEWELLSIEATEERSD